MNCTIAVSACTKRLHSTSVTTSAPALINGLRGLPCSYSSCTSELKALPEGSRPTRCHRSSPSNWNASVQANSLEMLWMENGTAASPTQWLRPSANTSAMPKCVAGTLPSSGM